MLARLKGARAARGDVLIFLDAHCEGGADWMRPLLERVKHKRDAVLTPIIDVIDQSTFKFEAPETYQVRTSVECVNNEKKKLDQSVTRIASLLKQKNKIIHLIIMHAVQLLTEMLDCITNNIIWIC